MRRGGGTSGSGSGSDMTTDSGGREFVREPTDPPGGGPPAGGSGRRGEGKLTVPTEPSSPPPPPPAAVPRRLPPPSVPSSEGGLKPSDTAVFMREVLGRLLSHSLMTLSRVGNRAPSGMRDAAVVGAEVVAVAALEATTTRMARKRRRRPTPMVGVSPSGSGRCGSRRTKKDYSSSPTDRQRARDLLTHLVKSRKSHILPMFFNQNQLQQSQFGDLEWLCS